MNAFRQFQEGPPKEDKLVVQLITVTADDSDAVAVFKSNAVQTQLDLPLSAQ